MTDAAPLLEVQDLQTFFHAEGTVARAVDGVSFTVGAGETLAIVGESGSGKSVTSLSIMRLVPIPPGEIAGGRVLFRGRDLLALPEPEMRHIRGNEIGMIFQEPMSSLNPLLTVGEQISEVVRLHQGLGRTAARQRAIEMLGRVNIPDPERRAREYPHRRSGGMRQRVMIAMAIVNRPELLIADEPTTALDVTVQAQVLDLLARLREKFGLAMLFISHDLAVVSHVADQVGVMYAGTLVELGLREEIFRAPAHPYTRGLLDAVPTLKSDRQRPLQTIEGSVPAIGALPAGCPFDPRCDLRVEDCGRELPALEEVGPGHWARCPVTKAMGAL
jgi:oligopeptide/dipeptide ABC transporter ATP-binding protein